MIDIDGGQLRLGSRLINDADRHETLSFEDVIVRSSNVGAIKVGMKLGALRLGEYVRRFGFGRPLSPDFRGESAGIVWSAAALTESALASLSMGYQVGVTPLQMIAAANSVANGGELLEPRVVSAVVRDGQRLRVPRKVLGRTVSRETATQLTAMMEGVVERGTAPLARIPGYEVAGKTGTAAKVVNGRYSKSAYNVSFVGFVPSRNPVFTIIVVVDTPRAMPAYGGMVAAPIFARIAASALRHYGVTPSIDPPLPVIVSRRQTSTTHAVVRPAGVSSAIALARAPRESASLFPDLRGLSAREALRTLTRLGLTARLRGAGLVVAQDPLAGTHVEPGSAATLWLDRFMPGPEPPATVP